jgi:DNA-binding response OmpR family regulator
VANGVETPSRVLIFGGRPDEVGVLERILGTDGHQTLVVTGDPDALEPAQTFRPDIVVLDLDVPTTDGIEAVGQIRASSDPYVLILSSGFDQLDRVMRLVVGADDYLMKPFSPSELVGRLHAMGRRPGPSNGQIGGPRQRSEGLQRTPTMGLSLVVWEERSPRGVGMRSGDGRAQR